MPGCRVARSNCCRWRARPPVAALSLQDYRSPPPRLAAMTWGAEDLSAALGATTNRDDNGEFLLTYKIVRTLCLIAAKAAGGRRD